MKMETSPPVAAKRDFGPRPVLVDIDVARMSVDPRYQRDTGSRRSQNMIQKIAETFKWARFGVVMVVKVDARYFVIDGQHRVEAARSLGIDRVPCVVLPHTSVEAAAADFVAINRDRVAVTPLHIHHAELAAGEPTAKRVAQVCKAAKVEICRYPVPSNKLKPGQTLAIATIQRMVEDHGVEFATQVLKLLRDGPGGDVPGAINAPAIRKLALAISTDPKGAKIRKCLGCGRGFTSLGSRNHMCEKCG
ncbi:MAG: ParB N-terminal domain-containing protein [Alphaproteobacteria bacterium]|nr:ParB N-terminal domain-containing protein [Alphaproteobacteria bacterium]